MIPKNIFTKENILLSGTIILLAAFISTLASHLFSDTFRLDDATLVAPSAYLTAFFLIYTFLYSVTIHTPFNKLPTISALTVMHCSVFFLIVCLLIFSEQIDYLDIVIFHFLLIFVFTLAAFFIRKIQKYPKIQLLLLYAIMVYFLKLSIDDTTISTPTVLFYLGITAAAGIVLSIRKYSLQTILIVILIIIGILFGGLLTQLRYTAGNVSLHTYLDCYRSPILERAIDNPLPYRKTVHHTCVPRDFCKLTREYITCRDTDRSVFNGYEPIVPNPHTFHVEKRRTLSGVDFLHWIVTIDDQVFFYTPYKGNGRFFPADPETLEYLGDDTYRDKDGLIKKNKRVTPEEALQ